MNSYLSTIICRWRRMRESQESRRVWRLDFRSSNRRSFWRGYEQIKAQSEARQRKRRWRRRRQIRRHLRGRRHDDGRHFPENLQSTTTTTTSFTDFAEARDGIYTWEEARRQSGSNRIVNVFSGLIRNARISTLFGGKCWWARFLYGGPQSWAFL